MNLPSIHYPDRSQLLIILAIIALVVAARLLPMPANVAPIGALGLFAGAFLPTRLAWLLPVGALLISDAVIGFYALPVMAMVYLGFAAGAIIGRVFLARRQSAARLAGAVLCSATVFFIMSNFAVWLSFYPNTLAGFIQCYVNAIPFFGRSLLGDALFASLMFGSYALFNVWHRPAHYA